MKILLTGYKGFIGSHMLKALKDHNVTTFEWGEQYPDIAEHDWVIHMGANSSTTERNIEKIMLQNYDFSVWLLHECIKYNVNLQYSSSASVYGLGKEFNENSPVDPRTPYAWTKYLFERYVKNLNKSITVQGFRYFNVYGTGQDHKIGNASPHHTFKTQAINNGVITLFKCEQEPARDFVPVEYVIDVHLKFLNVADSGIWNIGTGTATTFSSIASNIAEQYDAKIKYIPMPEILKNSYQVYTCADTTKLRKHIQYENCRN
jgi:ADP-L-glycero-D-manno-heptose 6-epimerase